MTLPLVAPDDHWGVSAVLLAAGAAGMSERTVAGRALSAPLVATLLGLAASNAGVLPAAAPAYAAVNRYLLLLCVPLLLFGADVRRVLADTGRLLAAFLAGAAATTAGTLLAFWLVPLRSLGNDSWKMAAALMSRHIGGAVNYVAVCEALQASPSVVAAGLAADNLICALYFTTLFALASGIPPEPLGRSTMRVLDVATALAASAAICTLGVRLSARFGIPGTSIPIVTALVVALSTAFPSVLGPLAPSSEALAGVLMQVFFATVGASGSLVQVMTTAPSLFAFSLVQVAAHLALVLVMGRLAGLQRREVLLASNANVGGPYTAAGMATAKGWRSLLIPAILVGVFGYAVATFFSIAFALVVLKRMA
eukprot:SM000027S09630  [mRNA]  locus=s27:458982:460925:+ [translate_table: standard]